MKWIRVKDKLPEEAGEYLIWESGTTQLSIFCDQEWGPICFCYACMDNKYKPTHWMPLPEPPKEEK